MTTVGREVYVLRIPKCGDFQAGQVIAVTTSPAIPPRLYSLCSGTQDTHWDILFNINHQGLLTPRLADLQAGDEIYVSMPFGSFIDHAGPSWWIAAGTGIAPFHSMLRSGLGSNKQLVHGARRAHGFYFASEFQATLDTRYTRCCSQEDGNGLYAGRLTNWLREQDALPPDMLYLLCGSAEMVVQVRDILLAKNVPFDNIRSEIYF